MIKCIKKTEKCESAQLVMSLGNSTGGQVCATENTVHEISSASQPNNPIHFYRVGGVITFVSQETTSVLFDFEPDWWATGSTLTSFALVAFIFLALSPFSPSHLHTDMQTASPLPPFSHTQICMSFY